jgi:hypothetical protein
MTENQIRSTSADSTGSFREVNGDLFEHVESGDTIVHIVNNVGAWGAGFVVPLGIRYPTAKQAYEYWAEGPSSIEKLWKLSAVTGSLKLGEIQIVICVESPGVHVVNMCAQNSVRSSANPQPLDYVALLQCLSWLKSFTPTHQRLVMPRIGSGLAGGDWPKIRNLIQRELPDHDITVYVL